MEASLKKVIFTCGGTAGHVNPAIALAQLMREKDPETEFLFVGAERGLEKDLIPKAGYDFRTVHISSFHRSFKPREIRHNLVSVGNLLRAPGEARAILRQFRPDVVIGTGGYASFPMVKAAAKAGIPTAVHESNMVPGLTTEMLEPFADRIMVGFEACREHYRHPEKVIVTGTPVRRDFFHLTKAEAKRRLGVEDGRPLLVSFWGSLGASGMNRQMADFLALEAAKEPFHHIHGAGADQGLADLQALLACIRLGNEHRVNVHAQGLGIVWVQGMLGVNEGSLAAQLLGLRQDVQGQSRFSRGFRAVDLDDAAAWDSADTQGNVQAQGTGRDSLYRDPLILA